MRKEKSFKLRPFISYFVTLSFIHLIVSSIVLYIAPPGRFANWNNWKILGITKGGWEAQHTIVGFLFVIASAVHLVLNWKVFISYLKRRSGRIVNRIWELSAAVVLIILLTAGIQMEWAPFAVVMNLGERLSNGWEERTLLSTSSRESSASDTTVQESESGEEYSTGTGQGMGRKTLGNVIEENGLNMEDAVEKLKNAGIDAAPGDNMKALSTEYNMGFGTILEIMTGE